MSKQYRILQVQKTKIIVEDTLNKIQISFEKKFLKNWVEKGLIDLENPQLISSPTKH